MKQGSSRTHTATYSGLHIARAILLPSVLVLLTASRSVAGSLYECRPGESITGTAGTSEHNLTCHLASAWVVASDEDEVWRKIPHVLDHTYQDRLHYQWTVPVGVPDPGDQSSVAWTPTVAGDYVFSVRIWDHPDCTEANDPADLTIPNITVTVVDPVPTNFHEVSHLADSNGMLYLVYDWDSSTGDLADLAELRITEHVTYPGGNPYVAPCPPMEFSHENPFTWPQPPESPILGSDGTLYDSHAPPGFETPYTYASFTGTQYYRFERTCRPGVFVNLAGPLSLTRSVYPLPPPLSGWYYQFQKPKVPGPGSNAAYLISLP
jgi:hypothetical protein